MAISDTVRSLWSQFKAASATVKLIVVNIAVFVTLRLAAIAGVFSGHPELINSVLDFVQLPSSPALLLTRPWTVITYMFAQYDLLHLIFNLLWLYWFGTLFTISSTPRRMVALYLMGGLGGALLFIIGYNFLPLFRYHLGWLIGSSASVMAIVTATAILMPDFKMNLLFLGAISLKWIAIATIVLVLIGATGNNAGGEMAHIGGILTGVVFAVNIRRGRDITAPFSRCFDTVSNLFSQRIRIGNSLKYRRTRTVSTPPPYQNRTSSPGSDISETDRAELDAILDKIKKSGYIGLSAEERRKLFDVSRKIK